MKKYLYIVLSLIAIACSSENKEASTVSPTKKGEGIFSLEGGNLYFEVDASQGGRISSFKINAHELLSGKEVNAESWGSTFWTSPQSDWKGSPPVAIDKEIYEGTIEGNSIVLKSSKDENLGYSVVKRFSLDLKDTSIAITYTIVNNSQEKKKVAPWEVTRVVPGGLTLFPIDGKNKKHKTPLLYDQDGIAYFEYDTKQRPAGKVKEQGREGWMAYIIDNIAFIKKFTPVTADKIAPGEGEIELYANSDNSFMEMEEQGEYAELNPKGSLSWKVKWYLKIVPEKIKIEKGNKDLVSYVRGVAGK